MNNKEVEDLYAKQYWEDYWHDVEEAERNKELIDEENDSWKDYE